MSESTPDTIQNVAHLAPEAICGDLEELGAEEIIAFPDVLSHGPSHREPKRHRELRLEYWERIYRQALGEEDAGQAVEALREGYLSAEQIGSVASHLAEERRIVVWTAPTFQDRLFMWMAFDGLRQAGVPAERIATAEPQVGVPPEGERYYALRDLELEELIGGFDEIVYPEEIYIQAGAQLWQTFGSGSPRKFAISVPHTEKFFPEITTIAENYGWLFPRVRGEGGTTMEVSELDESLLGELSVERWRTPFEVLGGEVVEQFDFVDDLAVAARLYDWATVDETEPYVEVREADGEAGYFERREYRLTEKGEALVEEGMGEGDEAPVLWIGDCRIYAGAKPWVRTIEGEHWWFERFSPEER